MLGNKVKIQRTKKGYTQKELAERVGITHAAISKLENHSIASKQIIIGIGRELESDFGLNWLQSHFKKYPLPEKGLMELITETIRKIVREELNKDNEVLDEIIKEKKINTKIPRHKKKKDS